MEMEIEFTAEDDPDKMKDVLAKLEVSPSVNVGCAGVSVRVQV